MCILHLWRPHSRDASRSTVDLALDIIYFMAAAPSASVAARLDIPEGTCALSYDALDVQTIIQSVADDDAGATAVFIGTTRNSFKGKYAHDEQWAYSAAMTGACRQGRDQAGISGV